jgi:hypothetical protein
VLIKCVGNTADLLGPFTGRYFFTERTKFHITSGSVYRASGMGIWETVLQVLIRDDTGLPSWYPVVFFDFAIYALPLNWEFVILDPIAASGGESLDRWVAIWGYRELVRNADHNTSLLERDPGALKIFDQQEAG